MSVTFNLQTKLAARLAPIVLGLCGMIAVVAARDWARTKLLVLVYSRLCRMVTRLDRLAARWESGRLRPARPRARRPAVAASSDPDSSSPAASSKTLRVPGGNAWLIRLVQPTVQFSLQVEMFLDSPEVAALLEAAPQAVRIFRPLARMLGIRRFEVKRPPRVRAKIIEAKAEPDPPPRPRPQNYLTVPAKWRTRVPGLRFSSA